MIHFNERLPRTAALEAAMSDAIDCYEHAAMVASETDDPWWDWLAAERGREADAAIAAFHAALDAEAANERRDEAMRAAEDVARSPVIRSMLGVREQGGDRLPQEG